SQKMETRMKDLDGELSTTRKQYEEAKANSQKMEKRVKDLEGELSTTRKQYDEAKAN
ncbi:hypothetical protein ACJMK2_002653, partial [Sinanodonta woodiana]